MPQISKLSSQKILNGIIAWGARILFIIAVIVMSVLSFVESFNIVPEIRNLTTMGLIAAALNYLVWESFYKQQYEKVLNEDMQNKLYSVHRRYYSARKGWRYTELQERIRKYNKDFQEAWEKDCEDATGYTIEQIRKAKYKKFPHKIIMWRIKHRRYPKTGIKTPNDVLYILNVGKANTMKIDTRSAEHFHVINMIRKIVMLVLGSLLIASLSYKFIEGNYLNAAVTLILNVAILFMALFFGATTGIKGGKLKLDTAEIVSERLEEWRDIVIEKVIPAQVQDVTKDEDSNKSKNAILNTEENKINDAKTLAKIEIE